MAIASHVMVSQHVPVAYLIMNKAEESAYKCHFLKGRCSHLWIERAQNLFKICTSSHQSLYLSSCIGSNS